MTRAKSCANGFFASSMLLHFLVSFFLVSFAVEPDFDDEVDVIVGNENNFYKIMDSSLPVLVQFYSSKKCSSCKEFAHVWGKAATLLKSWAHLVKVDCTLASSLCTLYNIKTFPTIKIFRNKGKISEDYQFGKDLGALMKFATSEIEDKIFKINNDEDYVNFLSKDPSLPHFIHISADRYVSPSTKALSCMFDGTVVVGLVRKEIVSVVEKFDSHDQHYPQFIIINQNQEIVKFEERTTDTEQMHSWLSQYARGSDEYHNIKKIKETSENGDEFWLQLNRIPMEIVDEACRKNKCIFAFTSFDEETGEPVQEQRVIFNQILPQFKGGKLLFFVSSLDGEFSSKFNIQGPTVLTYNSKKRKISQASAFTSDAIHEFLENAEAGTLNYHTSL